MRTNDELNKLYLKIQSQVINEHKELLFDVIKALSNDKKDEAQNLMTQINKLIQDALKENAVTEEEYKVIKDSMLTPNWQHELKELIMKGLKNE